MKNLKKFAALLLAGAMALLMLTACGGGGGEVGERVPDAESKPLWQDMQPVAQASNIKENNKSLQAIADGYLQKDLNTEYQHLWHRDWSADVHVDGEEERISDCYRNWQIYTGGLLSVGCNSECVCRDIDR